MPYFWESPKWIKRLDDLKIWRQQPSGHCMDDELVTSNSIFNIAHSRLAYIKHICQGFPDFGHNIVLGPLSGAFDLLKPGGHEAYNNPDYFISKLFNILTVLPGDSILEYLLYKPGVARVKMNDDLYELRTYMEDFLCKLSGFLEKHDYRFKFTPNQMGSMAEETRAGFGDEYDYRLDLGIDSKCIKDLFNDANLDIRKVYNEVNSGSFEFLKGFYPALKATLMSLLNEQSNWPFKFVGFDFNDTGVMYLCFEWRRGDPKHEMLVKMDCIPALVLNDFWPNDCVCDPSGNAIKPLCHIVLKLNTKSNVLHPAWSVSYAEVVFMAKLPDYIKDGYTLCKNLLGLLINNLSETDSCLISFQERSLPSSYHLKNGLFDILHTGKTQVEEKSMIDSTMGALNVAYNIVQSESASQFKAFFMSEREMKDEILKPHGTMLLRILKDLEDQHRNRRVPSKPDSSGSFLKLHCPEVASIPFQYTNEMLGYIRDADEVTSMAEYEKKEQLDKIGGKIQQSFLDVHTKLVSTVFTDVVKRKKSQNQNPEEKGSDSEISLD